MSIEEYLQTESANAFPAEELVDLVIQSSVEKIQASEPLIEITEMPSDHHGCSQLLRDASSVSATAGRDGERAYSEIYSPSQLTEVEQRLGSCRFGTARSPFLSS